MEEKMEDEVYCGKQFDCWDDFFEAVEVFSARTAQPFVKTSSKLAATANKTIQNKFPDTEELKYSYYQIECTHRGSYKGKGEGEGRRKNKSFKSGCLAKIYAAVDKSLHKVVVKSVLTDHNHPIGHEVFQHYPRNRKLDSEEEASVAELSKMKVSTKMLREHVEKEFGKIVRLSDIRNLKSKVRSQERIESASTSLNDAQRLMKQLAEQQEADPGAVYEIGVREDGVLRQFFFQSTAMREIFSRFPAHVLIDCTYLYDRVMPLLSFLCIDGNNESRIVGFAVIGEETKDMFVEIFQIFKEHNAPCHAIQSFMVDREMEISSLQEIFPSAEVEICLFRAMKAMKAKLSASQCGKDIKGKLRDLCSTCCYANNEAVYEHARMQIFSLDPIFGQYFNDTWHVMRHRWVQFWRCCSRENYHNRTDNRIIESYHQKLKSEVSRDTPLDRMFCSILTITRTLEVEISYRMFQHSMRNECSNTLPHLKTTLTPFAYDHCCNVLKKSEALYLQCISDINSTTVISDSSHFIVLNDSFCNCISYTSSKLPCVHVVAARRSKNVDDVLPLTLFADRWLLKTNSAIVSDGVLAGVDAKPIANNNRVLSKAKKFALAKQVLDRIVTRMTELGTVEFKKCLAKLKELELELGGGGDGVGVEEEGVGGGDSERKGCKRKGGKIQKSCASNKKMCIEGGGNGDVKWE